MPKRRKTKKNEKNEKNEKGSRKSSFWQFPRSILKAKEGKKCQNEEKTKKQWKKMKRVREKAPLAIPQVSFKGKERKKIPKRKNNEKGSRKSSFWQFPKSVLKAQKGKIANMRKKRKGFEKKLLLAIPQVNFKGIGKKNS